MRSLSEHHRPAPITRPGEAYKLGTADYHATVQVVIFEPSNWTFDNLEDGAWKYFRKFNRLNHSTGGHFAMFDGSIRFMAADSDHLVLQAMGTRAGGESVPGHEKEHIVSVQREIVEIRTAPSVDQKNFMSSLQWCRSRVNTAYSSNLNQLASVASLDVDKPSG